ncbi:MAG: HEAT repeat domain-containing protein [Elusimicrobiota bacterium]|nr:HEAT repeat domain-containing protein [Elusimicrobiota bacterium]
MRYPAIVSFCVIFLLGMVFTSPVCAQNEAKKLYKGAEEKYARGEVDEAISDLESALQIDSKFRKAEELLLKILIAVSTEYYAANDYERAFPYLTKAYNLAPANAKIKYMYDTVSQELITKEAEKKASELEAQRKAEQERREAELETRRKEEELVEKKKQDEEKRKRELEAKGKREEEKKRRDEIEATMKSEREETEKALLARKEEVEKATNKYEETRNKYKTTRNRLIRTIILGIVGILLSFLGAIFLIFIIFKYSDRRFEKRWKEERAGQDEFRQRVEKILLGNQERILGLLEKLSGALRGETKKVVVERPDGGREIITDLNPHIRARADGVELIEATVDDPGVGERLLKPFLEDRDSRVRANAGKALYKYNKEKAMVVLTEMSKSDDQWMRLSVAWALGEIGSKTAAEILLSLLQDSWEFVRKRAAKSLEKILIEKKEEIEANLLETIASALKQLKK